MDAKNGLQIGDHMDLARVPSFWDPKNVYDPHYMPDIERAREEGRKLGLRPANNQIKDGGIHLSIGIDMETDFMDYLRYVKLPITYGRLPVTGALDDIVRWAMRIIRGTYEEYYTHHMLTFDRHPPFAIHTNLWWKDESGNPPNVELPVQMELVDEAKFLFRGHFVDGSTKYFYPATMKQWAVKYAKHLIATDQGFIWVFTSHCREGSDGAMLVPALLEIYEWACAARKIQPIYLYKGMIAEVDWFGPFRPCMDVPTHPQGGLQTVYLDYIKDVKVGDEFKETKSVDMGGEAWEFCFGWGVRQIADVFKGQLDILRKIHIVGDCSSPIIPGSLDCQKVDKVIAENGLNLIKHDTPFVF